MKYEEVARINVNDHVRQKNGLNYLSWAWAVDQLLRIDPTATWEYREPVLFGETMMVFCTVTAFGVSRTAQLPVMNHKNQAIPNPDSYAVNTAMQRCLVKAIALHGLGLYIYEKEDAPFVDQAERENDASAAADKLIESIEAAQTLEQLREVKAAVGMANLAAPARKAVVAAWNARKAALEAA